MKDFNPRLSTPILLLVLLALSLCSLFIGVVDITPHTLLSGDRG